MIKAVNYIFDKMFKSKSASIIEKFIVVGVMFIILTGVIALL